MPAHQSYTKPEYLAVVRAKARAQMAGDEVAAARLRAFAAARRVVFTEPMRAALLRMWRAGRGVEYMAEDIGVSLGVLRREMRELGLAVGRWARRA
jgi:hypothetical protein